jgi:hypothetical protein
MARIVAEKSESSFSQVIHFAGVRRFGEAQQPSELRQPNQSDKFVVKIECRKQSNERQPNFCREPLAIFKVVPTGFLLHHTEDKEIFR